MTTVYALWHEYEPSPGVDSELLIGVYSTRENAEKALLRVRDKPGFIDYPDHFVTAQVRPNTRNYAESAGRDPFSRSREKVALALARVG